MVGYDAKAGTDSADDVALLVELGLSQASTLVDLGAGTGMLALAVAPLCRRVVAVDVSAAMLHRLHARATQLGLDNVECVHAGFLSYEHQNEPADVVYSRNALHHLPDFWQAIALARVAAILRPGGILRLRDLVYSFAPAETEQRIKAWLANAASHSSRGWTRPELETHLRDEYSTFSWLLEPMLEHTGFEIRDVEHTPSRIYSAYTCINVGT